MDDSLKAVLPYLLGFLTGALSWVAGMAASTFLQDREHIRRQRGTVRALLTEIRRIRAQLGGSDSHWIDTGILGNRAAIPGIHPWVSGCIVDVAQSEPVILAKFMHLELLLGNQALFVSRLREVRDETRAAIEQPQPKTESSVPAEESEAIVASLLARLEAKLERKERERAVGDAVAFVDVNHRAIVASLSGLSTSLENLDELLSREPTFDFRRLLGTPVALAGGTPKPSVAAKRVAPNA